MFACLRRATVVVIDMFSFTQAPFLAREMRLFCARVLWSVSTRNWGELIIRDNLGMYVPLFDSVSMPLQLVHRDGPKRDF